MTTEAKYAHFAEAGCAPLKDYDPSTVELVQGWELKIDRGYRSPEIIGTPYASYMYFNVGDTFQFAIAEVPGGYGHTQADVTWISTDESVMIVDANGLASMVGPGEASIRAFIPVIYYGDVWTEKSDRIPIRVDP